MAKRLSLPEPTNTAMLLQVAFEDGTEAVALSSEELQVRLEELVQKPVLRNGRGSGSSDAVDYDYWLTPKPSGAITIKFAWPEQGLPPTEIYINQAALQRASSEAIELWALK